MNARTHLSNGIRLAGAGLIAALLSACGGHSTGSGPLPNTVAAPAKNNARTASVSFHIVIPSASSSTSAGLSKPAYVSVSTKSVTISVAPAGDAGPTTLNCTTAVSCDGTVSAPVGASDVFTVSLYDGTNATGNLLSKGVTPPTAIVAGKANVVPVTFNPVVASVTFGPLALIAGTPAASTPLAVAAKDAAGNTIIGPGTFIDASGNAVTIGAATPVVDASTIGTAGTVTVSGTAAQPSDTLSVAYNGGNLYGATLTPTVTGSTTVTKTASKVTVTAVVNAIAASGSPGGIVALGSNLWYGARGGNVVGSVTTSGATGPSALAGPTGAPLYGTVGSDGNLWFGDWGTGGTGSLPTPSRILKIVPATQGVTAYTVPSVVGPPAVPGWDTVPAVPIELALGNDNNVWFAERGYGDPQLDGSPPPTAVSKIGKITPAGVITEYPLPAGAHPYGIVNGPGGNLWFTEDYNDRIGEITTAGVVTEHNLNTNPGYGDANKGITVGYDGTTLYFCRQAANSIGAWDSSSDSPAFYVLPHTTDVATQPEPKNIIKFDNKLWFTESNTGKIGVLDPSVATAAGPPNFDAPQVSAGYWEFTLPANAVPVDLVVANNNVWVTDSSGRILQITNF